MNSLILLKLSKKDFKKADNDLKAGLQYFRLGRFELAPALLALDL
jgi:hypothetical protein